MLELIQVLFDLVTGAPSRKHPAGSRAFAWILWSLAAAALVTAAVLVFAWS